MTAASGIYKIENTANGQCYVGSAANVYQRIHAHKSMLRLSEHHSLKLQRAWLKYGEAVFLFSVIELIAERVDLVTREQFWIDKLHAFGENGYNMAPKAGSTLGRRLSAETRARISAVQKGKKRGPYPPEVGAKISAARKGIIFTAEHRANLSKGKRGLPGKKHTAETRARMSIAQKESKKFVSAETRARLSASHKGKRPTDEARKNQSLAQMGRKLSAQTRAKIAAAHLGKPKGRAKAGQAFQA